MLEHTFIQKLHMTLLWIVLVSASVALVAELLPETEAKVIVVPTLVMVIALVLAEYIARNQK
jgi:hypothetical protein